MDSVLNEVEGINLYTELSELWKMAGMHTHKWLSNSSVLMNKIPMQDRTCKLEFDENISFAAKPLGILWIAAEDNLSLILKELIRYVSSQKEISLKGLQHYLIH